jgi:DNA-binding MarR family transcriptional regulator
LLSEGPKHGYQLMKELEERSGGMYKASAGTIYPTLQQLEDEELIEVERENGKKTYRLTAAGRKELAQDPETVKRIWERAGHWEDWGQYMGPHVGGVIGPAMQVVRSALRAASKTLGRPEREEKIRRVLERVCRDLDELEKDWR